MLYFKWENFMRKYDLIIIGAGSGGLAAANEASKLGLKTLLIEKNKLGGDCLWNGCIPSKTLIHEADKMRVMREENFSVDFSAHFEEVKKRIVMVQEEISTRDSVEKYSSMGVETIIGLAKFIDKNKVKVGREKFKFKKCIVATGSRPMVPDIFKTVKYYTNENIFSIEKLPTSMTIIGGGSVGVELASSFAMFGTKIKMILKEDRIMPREEPEIGEFMKVKMKELGIEIFDRADVKEVFERNGNVLVSLQSGIILESEVLVVATGRNFNTDLDLKNAGVELGERKEVKINDYLQTTNKKIYAIGDCNGFRLFTHAAGYQAKAAIKNMSVPSWLPFFKQKSIPDAFPWVTYTYPEVAHVGAYKKDLIDKNITHDVYTTNLEAVDRAQTSKVKKEGFIQVIVGRRGKILGVTIVSPHAGELITEWVLAMSNNLKVEAIFNTVHAYPTLSELNPRGTFEYINKNQNKFKFKLLKLLFKL